MASGRPWATLSLPPFDGAQGGLRAPAGDPELAEGPKGRALQRQSTHERHSLPLQLAEGERIQHDFREQPLDHREGCH